MKVKVLTRNPDHYLRATKQDIHKVQRNYDPELHPLEAPREYTRALNAVKLERVFAKPFLYNLEGHRDGVCCVAKHPTRVSVLASGAYDGEIRMWNLAGQCTLFQVNAHEGVTRCLEFTPDGESLMSVGNDSTIKTWRVPSQLELGDDEDTSPISTRICKGVISSLSHHQKEAQFATAGDTVQLWESSRVEPIKTFTWGVDSIHSVRFNPVQTNLLASCASDRSVILYDVRDTGPVRKVTLKLRANRLSWNPMEAFVFTVACEDFNLYTFDCRYLNKPKQMHIGFTSAATDVDYCPTGKEFVSGSYDKTIRIWESDKTASREVYHTKRMQRLTCVAYSLDSRYIISGSDEMNLRMWKAIAWQKLGVLRPREKQAVQYSEALKEKFAAHPEVRRIQKHRQVPRHVMNAAKEHRLIRDKHLRKDANRRKHSKKGTVPIIAAKRKVIIGETE